MSLFSMKKSKQLIPLMFSSKDTTYYLKPTAKGLALYDLAKVTPLYQLEEEVFVAHGAIAHSNQFHLVTLRANGNLCYTLITEKGQHQTTALTTLEVQHTTYRRLMVFPIGKMVHIFYAYAHLSIRELWHIAHCYWDGRHWRTARLGEVTHTGEPLFHVSQDTQGNLHLLMMTFQGQYSMLLSNRFNRAFMIWGNPVEVLKIYREVIDMASIMTPNNVHHVFWAAKIPHKRLEIAWAHRSRALEFNSLWNQAPSPIKTVDGNWQGLGVIERNSTLWLLANSDLTTLFAYDGESWKTILSQPQGYRPILWTHKNEISTYISYWLEEDGHKGIPAFYQEPGFSPISPLSTPPANSAFIQSPPPETYAASPPVKIPELYYSRLNTAMPDTSTIEVTTETPIKVPLEPPVEISSPQTPVESAHLTQQVSSYVIETLTPITETAATLQQKNQLLTTILETLLSEELETASSLQKIEEQIGKIQREKKINSERGFWSKWLN